MPTREVTRRSVLAAVPAFGLACAAGCSSSSGSGSSVKQDTTTKRVSLTFWSWTTNIDKVVAIWNRSNPDIHVTVSKVAQGDAEVTKLLTANKAGGGPDLFHAEYQALPVFVTAGAAADLTSAAKSFGPKFSSETMKLVSFGGKTYGIPQDVAPMGLFYRADLFKQFNLKVPSTWAEFAQVAHTLHAKDPKRYLTTFSSGDPGWFAGLAEQAGAQWWTNDGKSWKVGIADAATKKVAEYWDGLLKSGEIQGQPMYTPQWNQAMGNGTLLAWPSAVWGAGVLEGIAPKTKGRWEMAPMPQWSAGDSVTGFWGGSATAVSSKTKYRAQAEKFATWLNTSPEAVGALISIAAVYPAALSGQTAPQLDRAPAFMPNQPDYYKVAAQYAKGARGFTWGPDVNVTYGAYSDAFAKAISRKQSFDTALDSVQSASLSDMKKLGYSVATA